MVKEAVEKLPAPEKSKIGLVRGWGEDMPQKGDFAAADSFAITSKEEVSLYFHIPFCDKKCPYCHFYVIPNKGSHQELLSLSFEKEWALQLQKLRGKRVVSIYLGGGTPTLFALDKIDRLLQLTKQAEIAPDCEITIEANPEGVDQTLFAHLRKLGINRLSLGVQSLDNRSLETLERVHSAQQAKEAIWAASLAGFENISIDLMYDLPGQTLASFRYTLDQLKDLPIQHLSLYNLTIEPHTSFYKRKKSLVLPNGETSFQFLQMALTTFENLGFHRYEISAFAKKGSIYASRHNLGYWTARPFLGFGPSAFSYWDGERFRNAANLNRYARDLSEGREAVDFREKLPYPQNVHERLAVELRLIDGVDLKAFEKLPKETEDILRRLEEDGLLKKEGSRIKLTEKGLLFYDSVASEIV